MDPGSKTRGCDAIALGLGSQQLTVVLVLTLSGPHHPSGSQVRTRPNGFAIFWAPPNPEPDVGSGSAPTLNLGPDLGQVLLGSGPNPGSEPDCGITNYNMR